MFCFKIFIENVRERQHSFHFSMGRRGFVRLQCSTALHEPCISVCVCVCERVKIWYNVPDWKLNQYFHFLGQPQATETEKERKRRNKTGRDFKKSFCVSKTIFFLQRYEKKPYVNNTLKISLLITNIFLLFLLGQRWERGGKTHGRYFKILLSITLPAVRGRAHFF